MRVCIVSGNPKVDGLCQSIIDAARAGALQAGAEVDELKLCELNISPCRVCGEGWGGCRQGWLRPQTNCDYGDDGFEQAVASIRQSDAIILASPVYWGEVSESLKSFLDRLRRCECGSAGALRNKQTLLIASPGGSGNGLLSTLEQLDRFCRHTGAIIFDYIGVNRWNRDYTEAATRAAAGAMASGRKNGDTV